MQKAMYKDFREESALELAAAEFSRDVAHAAATATGGGGEEPRPALDREAFGDAIYELADVWVTEDVGEAADHAEDGATRLGRRVRFLQARRRVLIFLHFCLASGAVIWQ